VSDEQAIRALIERWHSATKAGDLETVLTLMTDDAIFLTPGRPPMTKSEFAKSFKSWSGSFRVESQSDIKEIYVSGDLAYCWSQISVVMTPITGGKENRRSGNVLSVFRKSPGGKWQLSRDANLL
jgi:uncharacterized protein (TIGR02246 family)